MRGQSERTDGGIERGEHSGRNKDFSATKSVKQCGFAGVGVSDQRDSPQGDGIASFAALRALFANIGNGGFNFVHAVADAAAIRFEVFFARGPKPASSRPPTRRARRG